MTILKYAAMLLVFALYSAPSWGQVAEPKQPPEKPAPETNKPIVEVISPKDGDIVKGVMDVKFRVAGRKLKSYKAVWYNSPGQPGVPMQDDEEEGVKVASIDFSKWKWQGENDRYPLRFRATEPDGKVIGTASITVVVAR